jgi:hypothetical protein
MAKLSKPPPLSPIKPLPTAKPPPVSKTQDNYTHHTSPVHGPQAVAPEVVTAQAPRAKVSVSRDIPMHVTKHTSSDGEY